MTYLYVSQQSEKNPVFSSGLMLIITKHHQYGLYLYNHEDFCHFSYKAINYEVICYYTWTLGR